MNKFKVGDRVCCYYVDRADPNKFIGRVSCVGNNGEVVIENGLLMIVDELGVAKFFHPNQCRKLVKKKRYCQCVGEIPNYWYCDGGDNFYCCSKCRLPIKLIFSQGNKKESQFKVGDKCIFRRNREKCEVTGVLTVEDSISYNIQASYAKYHFIPESELEVYQEEPKFKVGDKVILKNHNNQVAEITSYSNETKCYSAKFGCMHPCGIDACDIDFYKEPSLKVGDFVKHKHNDFLLAQVLEFSGKLIHVFICQSFRNGCFYWAEENELEKLNIKVEE